MTKIDPSTNSNSILIYASNAHAQLHTADVDVQIIHFELFPDKSKANTTLLISRLFYH